MSKKQKSLILWLSVAAILVALIIGCAIYLSIYYKADAERVEAILASEAVTVEEHKKFTSFTPKTKATTGFIFYPGGKVDEKAYYPLLHTLAEYGIFTAVAKMPAKLAVFNSNAANKIMDEYPEIENWYIGGHSLGGAMAASYLSKNENGFKGLVLLGAYSSKDISDTDVAVLSVYGSNDGVMNKKKYEKFLSNMPVDFSEFVIDGGNHAYFGIYGEQKGDGIATLTDEEQILLTASQIYVFISSHE